MRKPSVEGLEVFLEVARWGSFRRAAASLGVTTPAVSQHVRKLEERLGVPLFARTTRRVALTEAGQALHRRCWPAWEELKAAIAATGENRDVPSGTLRLNVPHMAVPLILDRVLPVYCARYPRVKVEVRVDDGLVDLLAGGFDAGIRLGSMVERDMVAVALTPPLRYGIEEPGLSLCFPSRAQVMPKLRAFIDTARRVQARKDRKHRATG